MDLVQSFALCLEGNVWPLKREAGENSGDELGGSCNSPSKDRIFVLQIKAWFGLRDTMKNYAPSNAIGS